MYGIKLINSYVVVPKNMKQSPKILLYSIREPFKKINYTLLLLVLFLE